MLLVLLGVQAWRRPFWINDGVVVVEGGRVTLPARIDPNEAGAEELGRIPHVGEPLAQRIVAYREARKGTAAEGVVFRRAEDLDAVPGVGPRLIQEMQPFLRFPGDEN
jgi:DNA uptake protein ComE-like DNA-binding protein